MAAEKLAVKIKAAAEMLQCSPSEVEIFKDRVFLIGDKDINLELAEIAHHLQKLINLVCQRAKFRGVARPQLYFMAITLA